MSAPIPPALTEAELRDAEAFGYVDAIERIAFTGGPDRMRKVIALALRAEVENGTPPTLTWAHVDALRAVSWNHDPGTNTQLAADEQICRALASLIAALLPART